jgi:cobalt-zinc-cadmium efflux system membrane fusion protein
MRSNGTFLLLCAAALAALMSACPQQEPAKEVAVETEVALAEEEDPHAGHSHGETHAEESAEEHMAHDESVHAGESAAEHAAHSEPVGEEGGHEGHDHASLITLSPEQISEYGVETAIAKGGALDLTLTAPGEVAVNEDAVGHVLPRIAGIVKSVHKNIGDSVKKGELMVVIDSRELADAKAAYLAARERLAVAETNEAREKDLFEKGVSPEQDYLNAQNERRAAEIEVRAAKQVLHALGVGEGTIDNLAASADASLTRYEIYAPLSGRILEKHVSVGEMVSGDSEMFLIANLSTVWVHLNISQQDLPRIKEGQQVNVHFGSATTVTADLPSGLPDASGKISYIDALVAEYTRTARARVVIDNPLGQWRPGMFVTGIVAVSSSDAAVIAPLESIISFEGQQTVFIQDEHGFEPRTVTLGRQSATHVEILSGLSSGERYVAKGAYMVKAELGKSEAGHGH